MNPKTYNALKAVALVWLPALGTLVFAVTDIWNLSYGPQIVGTIMAVDTFLGVGLGVANRNYYSSGKAFDGNLLIDTSDPVTDTYQLDFSNKTPLDELSGRKHVMLKIKPAKLSPAKKPSPRK